MSNVPPEQGPRPQQPPSVPEPLSRTPQTGQEQAPVGGQEFQLDPTGQWQWNPQQQQWVPAQGPQNTSGGGGYQPDSPAGDQNPFANRGYAPGQSYSSPQGSVPGPGYGPPPGYPPQPGYPGAVGPSGGKPNARKLIFLAIAVAVVVVVIAGVLVGVFAYRSGGGNSAQSSSGTVTTYLNDLANGDATGALAQGPAPASTTFASAGILKQQQAKAKITNITIVNTQTTGTVSTVHATYQFGARGADETFQLTQTGGRWKLADTTIPIDVSYLTQIPLPTLFGAPLTNLSKVYVFPGPLMWGSQNKYFAVTDKNADRFAVSPVNTSGSFTQLTTDLNDAGKQAAQTAVQTLFQKCAQSKLLTTPGCPQQEYGSSDNTGAPTDGTVTWTPPTDLSGLQYNSGATPTTLEVSGTTNWKATYQAQDYTTNAPTTITDNTVKTGVYGTLDFSQTPPTFTQG